MKKIRFDFDEEKLVQVLAYLAEKKLPEFTPLKASKLLFLADKKHFTTYGRPIFGDAYVGMKNGPCPSRSLNLMNEIAGKEVPASFRGHKELFEEYLRVSNRGPNPVFESIKKPDLEVFSRSELSVLNDVVAEHGKKTGRELVDMTHEDPVYKAAWAARTNPNRAEIPYELFFEGSGPEAARVKELVDVEQDDRDFAMTL